MLASDKAISGPHKFFACVGGLSDVSTVSGDKVIFELIEPVSLCGQCANDVPQNCFPYLRSLILKCYTSLTNQKYVCGSFVPWNLLKTQMM
jgi:hypothetical protein